MNLNRIIEEAIAKGLDPNKAVAAAIYGVDYYEVTDHMRAKAKQYSYAALYSTKAVGRSL